MKTIGFHSM